MPQWGCAGWASHLLPYFPGNGREGGREGGKDKERDSWLGGQKDRQTDRWTRLRE